MPTIGSHTRFSFSLSGNLKSCLSLRYIPAYTLIGPSCRLVKLTLSFFYCRLAVVSVDVFHFSTSRFRRTLILLETVKLVKIILSDRKPTEPYRYPIFTQKLTILYFIQYTVPLITTFCLMFFVSLIKPIFICFVLYHKAQIV